MKAKTKADIDNRVAIKRTLGAKNIREKIKNLRLHMNEPGDIKQFKADQIANYEAEIYSLGIQIRRREENMEIARKLFEKNRHREELKIYKAQQGIETLKGYIAIYKENPKKKKKKKKFVPPDPVEEIIKEPEPVIESPVLIAPLEEEAILEPEFPVVEQAIPLTEEERAILIAEKEAALKELEDEDEFECPHCHRIYATAPALKRHITMRHKEV